MTSKAESSISTALIDIPHFPDEIIVSFVGPFSWFGAPDAACVYDAEQADKPGIYLWTVPRPDGQLIYYVGESGRTIGTRLRQHYKELAGARYHVFSAPEFARGEKLCLWPGRYDSMDRKTDGDCQANCERLSEQIREMMCVIRFFLAPLSCDTRLRRRVEAAIAQPLYAAPGMIGTFVDQGIHYSPRRNDELPVSCKLVSFIPLLGLPPYLWA